MPASCKCSVLSAPATERVVLALSKDTMTPDPGRVLAQMAAALRTDLVPDVRSPFGQQLALLAGTVADVLAQEIDRLADRLHEENAAVAVLLADVATLFEGSDLAV